MTPPIPRPKAVIFDFGGVLLDLDMPAMTEAFHALGIPDVPRLFSLYQAAPAFIDLEVGTIDPTTFAEALRHETGLAFDDDSLFQAWNALLGSYRLPSLDFVRRLGNDLPVYLYSNTNIIHYERFQQTLRDTTDLPSLDALFQKAYYSHQMGMRKPHPEGYLHILRENDLPPDTTLFVDDNADNIAGAAAVGLRTHHLQPEERIEQALAWLTADEPPHRTSSKSR
jgi:FMN phosphatase YigB (HAD superfamily)